MRQIQLIGGFYKDNSLTFSAQDTVNWLPVPDESSGARSPIKLRGVPGLRSLTFQDAPIPGSFLIFAKPPGGGVDQYSVLVDSLDNIDGAKRLASPDAVGYEIKLSGYGNGWVYASANSRRVIRSNDLGATWSLTTSQNPTTPQQRIDVRGGRVMFAGIDGSSNPVFNYSDDNGATWQLGTFANAILRHRHFYNLSDIVGGSGTPALGYSANNGASTVTPPGPPVFGRDPANICPGSTHLIVAGASAGDKNRFSRVPLSTPLISHTPFQVSAVDVAATWVNVAPSIAYGNGVFVMITDGGQIVRSADEGASWQVNGLTLAGQQTLVFAKGRFVIAGTGGMIYTSTDGIGWTQISSGVIGSDKITNILFIP